MLVDLSEQEWQQVINIIATAPWNIANPLLTKLTQQLQQQHMQGNSRHPAAEGMQAETERPSRGN